MLTLIHRWNTAIEIGGDPVEKQECELVMYSYSLICSIMSLIIYNKTYNNI